MKKIYASAICFSTILFFLLFCLFSTWAFETNMCPDFDGMQPSPDGTDSPSRFPGIDVAAGDNTNPDLASVGDVGLIASFSGKWYVKQVTSYMMDLKQTNNSVSGTIYAKRNGKVVKAGEVIDAVVSPDGFTLSGKWYWNYDPANRPPGAQEHLSKDGLELVLQPTLDSKQVNIAGWRIDPPFKRQILGSNIDPGW